VDRPPSNFPQKQKRKANGGIATASSKPRNDRRLVTARLPHFLKSGSSRWQGTQRNRRRERSNTLNGGEKRTQKQRKETAVKFLKL